jgi:tyrosyl-tRNA synthetase
MNIIDFLMSKNVFPTKGEARKMLLAGGISVNDIRLEAITETIDPSSVHTIKIGKKRVIKLNEIT